MNNLSLIIGIILIVIAIVFIFVGGWEKFHLQRENNAWLALFIVGWIIFVFGAGLILLAIFSNKKAKVPLDKLALVTPSGVVPLPAIVPSLISTTSGPPASSMISGPPASSMISGPPASSMISGPPASSMISGPPASSMISGPPASSMISGPLREKLTGGVIEYQPLQPTNYQVSLKGGLFD
jgi:hypothetical protein